MVRQRRDKTSTERKTQWMYRAMVTFLLVCALGCSPSGSVTGGSGQPLALDSPQMKTAAQEMLSISDTLDRHRRLVELMDALNEDNLPGAIEAYESYLSRVDPHEIRLFTNAWAQIDPKGALDRILDTWRYPRINRQAVLEVVTIWVQSGDGKAARAYVDPKFEGPIPSRQSPTKFMVLAVLQSLAVEGEYDELTAMLASLEDDGDRELFITEVMVEMNRAGGKGGVKAWLDSIPWDTPKNLKFSTLKRGLDWVSKMSGPQAARWYEEIESDPRAVQLLPMAVKSWGVRDPGAAILWLGDRQPTTVRAALVREIGRGWTEREAKAPEAEAWIQAHIEIPLVRDHLSLVLANYWAREKRFEDSIEMAKNVPTTGQRDHAIAAVLREWSGYDDDATEAFIASGRVPETAIAWYRKQTAENPIKVRRVRVAKPPKGQG
jgi:hypothetical protein